MYAFLITVNGVSEMQNMQNNPSADKFEDWLIEKPRQISIRFMFGFLFAGIVAVHVQ